MTTENPDTIQKSPELSVPPPAETSPAPEESYSIDTLPRTDLQERALRGDKLSLAESLEFGRDKVMTGEIGDGITTRPDRAYRTVNLETLARYWKEGGVELTSEGDIFVPGENNEGVDWYLGGVAPKYGDYVIEALAKKGKFKLAPPGMSSEPLVRHIKSEGGKNGILFSEIERILKLEKEAGQEGRPGKVSAKSFEVSEIENFVALRQQEDDQKRLATLRNELNI